MDLKQQTIETYNKSAKALADKFDSLGVRVSDIDETFKLVEKENPVVLEIGCGNGRDAQEILKRTNNYFGIDISTELIKLAQEKNPEGRFKVADVESFQFPAGVDIIFAFVSLLHVNRESLKDIIGKIFNALNPKGVVRISLKYGGGYREVTKEDEFGVRTYYYYSDQDIRELSKDFVIIKNEISSLRDQDYLEVILKKV